MLIYSSGFILEFSFYSKWCDLHMKQELSEFKIHRENVINLKHRFEVLCHKIVINFY